MINGKCETMQKLDITTMDAEALEQLLREKSRLLCARLGTADEQPDSVLRQEITDIAAGMLILTMAKEGDTSPLPALLAAALMASDDAGSSPTGPIIAAVKAMAPELTKN